MGFLVYISTIYMVTYSTWQTNLSLFSSYFGRKKVFPSLLLTLTDATVSLFSRVPDYYRSTYCSSTSKPDRILQLSSVYCSGEVVARGVSVINKSREKRFASCERWLLCCCAMISCVPLRIRVDITGSSGVRRRRPKSMLQPPEASSSYARH